MSDTVTNDDVEFERVVRWRAAAVADGWSIAPTYPGTEPADRAARLSRDGFTIQILTRDMLAWFEAGKQSWKPKVRYSLSITIWGPDGLQIDPPHEYDGAAIIAGLRHCMNCGADDVETQRFSFAGRCCAACRPEMSRLTEQPGWMR